jgi:hypothetical protein
MEISWRPVRVGVGSLVEEGQMVLVDGILVAILVHLTSLYNTPEMRGKWFVEVGFGPLNGKHELFSTLEEAEDWVLRHYLAERKRGSGRSLQS